MVLLLVFFVLLVLIRIRFFFCVCFTCIYKVEVLLFTCFRFTCSCTAAVSRFSQRYEPGVRVMKGSPVYVCISSARNTALTGEDAIEGHLETDTLPAV